MDNALEYEQFLLGSLIAGAPLADVLPLVDVDDFMAADHREVYIGLCELFARGVTINYASCLAHGVDLSCVMCLKPHLADLRDYKLYAEQVVRYARHRKAKRCLQSAIEALTAENTLEVCQRLGMELNAPTEAYFGSNGIREFCEEFAEWESDLVNTPKLPTCIYSGLSLLDSHIAALSGARLIFIAARPSEGKTALSVQVCVESALRGVGVGFFSLETTKPQLLEVMTASALRINRTKLANRMLDELHSLQHHSALEAYKNAPIYVFDDIFKLDAICAKITLLVKTMGVRLVIIDYIGLISAGRHRADSVTDYLGNISRELKQLTMQLKVPIIVLCQLNRDCSKLNREPMLADLRSCGSFEQDADCVILLHHDKAGRYNGPKGEPLPQLRRMYINIAKSRVGPATTAGEYIFNGQTQRYGDTGDYFNTAFLA